MHKKGLNHLECHGPQVRPRLLAAFRTACLHHDESGQAGLLNLLLRNYLQYNLYDQAVKLISKTSFPGPCLAKS